MSAPAPDVVEPDGAAGSPRTKVVAVLVVAAMLVAAQRMGLFTAFSHPAAIRELLLQLGPWGYIAFVAAYASLQPFGIPGTVFVFAASLIWPWPIAFALSMIGTMAASVVGFSFARFVARDWVAKRIPARFRRYDEALAKNAFTTVVVLRFIFWMPQVLHAFFGLSKVRFWTHFWGSFVGYLVPLFLVSYFGEKVYEVAMTWPAEVWVGVGLATAAIVGGVWWFRRRRRLRAAAIATPAA